MSWLVNQTCKPILTIDGTDYTDNLINITLADQSCVSNAIIICSGSIQLQSRGGAGNDIEEYPTAGQVGKSIDLLCKQSRR